MCSSFSALQPPRSPRLSGVVVVALAWGSLKTLVATAVVAFSLAVVLAMAQGDSAGSKASSTIEVIDVRGTRHVVKDYGNGSRFFRAGLPFDNNITDDYPKNGKGFWDRAKSLKTAIAVELHTPEDQAKIRKTALDRGMRESEIDQAHTVLLIPLPSLDSITFTQQKVGQNEGQARSEVRLVGGQFFIAGGGFWKLYGKENLGSLGTANFAADLSDVKSIRSLTPPVPFVQDVGFFGSTEVPFSAKVTDTAGEVSVLRNALYCTTATFSVPNNRNTSFVTYGDVGVTTVRFKSSLDVRVSGTSNLSIPPEKLRTVTLGKVDQANGWSGYSAKAVLRTGETVNFTITPSEGIYVPNGILGASPKGWVWIPWYAVASLEFDDTGPLLVGDSLAKVVERGDLAAPRTRLSSGANPNETDDSVMGGWTPLMAAAFTGNVDAAHLLLDSGAEIEAKTQFGKTALDVALMGGKTQVAGLLRSRGAKSAALLEAQPPAQLKAPPAPARASETPLTHAPPGQAASSVDDAGQNGGSIALMPGEISISGDLAIETNSFTCIPVQRFKNGDKVPAAIEMGQGRTEVWSVAKHSLQVGTNHVAYPIAATDGMGHALFPAVLKAKNDIKPGDKLRSDGYQIETKRAVKAGDAFFVLLIVGDGTDSLLSIEAGSDGEPWFVAFKNLKPNARASFIKTWRRAREYATRGF